MKKIFTLLCVTLSSLAAMAKGVEVNSIYYLLDSDRMTASVTYMGEDSSSDNNYIGDIVIPDTIIHEENKYAVTTIGDYAFRSCSGLTSVTIPNSVTAIGEDAFRACYGLTSVIIGNSVTSIKDYTFFSCHNLTSIIIPNSVKDIGNYAFRGCSKLISITLSNSMDSIGMHAFEGCSDLTSITLGDSVKSIGQCAFSSCFNLSSVTVSLNNPIYDSRDNCNAIIETATNTLIFGCQNSTIPNTITNIGDNAFSGCNNLTSITIPNSITSIGNSAFLTCSKLTSIVIPNSVIHIGDGAFSGCSQISLLSIGDSVETIGERAFSGCSKLVSVDLPNSVITIGNNAFEHCKSLVSLNIPNTVTSIGEYAFNDCLNISSIIIAYGNPKYDSRDNCNAIIETATNTLIAGCKNTIIPKSVTSIGNSSFRGCSNLTSINIPDSITNIGKNAFYNCSTLTSITCLAIEPPSLGNNVFYKVPRDIPLYVYASSVPAYQAAAQWNEFDIHWIVVDSITPDTTQLSWLPIDSVSMYKLRIYSEQISLDTTLLIEADSLNGGISIPVSLTPHRIKRMPMDDIGSVVVITLEPNSGATKETPFRVTVSTTSKNKIDILFDMDVLKGEKVFREESGSFTLNNITAIVTKTNEIKSSNRSISSGIYDLYGRHYSLSQWNQLPEGIYIVRDGEKASKVIKR